MYTHTHHGRVHMQTSFTYDNNNDREVTIDRHNQSYSKVPPGPKKLDAQVIMKYNHKDKAQAVSKSTASDGSQS